MAKVTAFIASRNHSHKVISLAQDIYDYVDEIVLVDSSNKEEREKIAQGKKAHKLSKLKIFYVVPLGYPDMIRMYALSKCTNDWVFLIDTDERASKELKENLHKLVDSSADAYSIRRYELTATMSGGEHLEESDQTRLFRKSKTTFGGLRHEQPVIAGKLVKLDIKDGVINHVAEIKGLTSAESGNMDLFDERFSYNTYNVVLASYAGKFLLPKEDITKTTFGRWLMRGMILYERLTLKHPDQELSDLDYLVYLTIKNTAASIQSRNMHNLIRALPDALKRLKKIQNWKRMPNSKIAFGVSQIINRIGITRFLELDKEETIEKLNGLYKDKKGGINLLMELLSQRYIELNHIDPRRKVVIFTGLDIRRFAGGEKYAIEMSNRLQNVNITFFSYKEKGEHKYTAEEVQKLTKSKIVYYNAWRIPIIVERLPLTFSALRAFSTLREYDVIYNYDPSLATILMLLFYSWRYKKRFIFGMHDPDPLKETAVQQSIFKNAAIGVFNFFRTAVVRMVPAIRLVNPAERRSLERIGYRGKVYVITDFINTAPKKGNIRLNKDEFVVLFANRLTLFHKGIDLLAKVIDETLQKNKEIIFTIVGPDHDGTHIVREIAHRYPHNVRWLGFVEHDVLLKNYMKSNLVISTSRFESFGLSIAEAQSYGLPAVSFDNKGMQEVMRRPFQGTLIRPFDTKEFADEIIRYHDKWKRGEITLSLKRRISDEVMGRYSTSVILPEVEKMFLE